jgi:Squalene-hopene cyclase C-terminal domain
MELRSDTPNTKFGIDTLDIGDATYFQAHCNPLTDPESVFRFHSFPPNAPATVVLICSGDVHFHISRASNYLVHMCAAFIRAGHRRVTVNRSFLDLGVGMLLAIFCTGTFCRGENPSERGIRESVERGLKFLEAGGVEWMNDRGCASCHHVPFLLWTHNEAKRRRFPVDAQKLESWTNWTLVNMLARGKDDGGGLETLTQVLLGRNRDSNWRRKPPRHNKTVDPYETLWSFLLEKQKPDGSFPSEGQRSFPEDISTSWALLALASRDSGPAPLDASEGLKSRGFGPALTSQLQKIDERIPNAQERALTWLRAANPDVSTQALTLRMLVSARFEAPERAREIRRELTARQRSDGGWACKNNGGESDAFATGQVLFALQTLGDEGDPHIAIRASSYLLDAQKPDGQWRVGSNSVHDEKVGADYRARTDDVYSYWGTAWAVIGLLHMLPAE